MSQTSSVPVASNVGAQIGQRKGIGALGALLCGFAHGLLCWLGQPSVSLWATAFFAVVPLVLVIAKTRIPPRWAALFAAIGTLPYWAVTQRWVFDITSVGYFPMLLLQAFWTWLFVWVASKCLRAKTGRWIGSALLIPLVWTGVEFLRCEVAFTGYAWGVLGYPLIADARLASPATVLGVYFVSFLVCVPSGAFAEWIIRSSGWRRRAVTTLCLAVLAWGLSILAMPKDNRTGAIAVGVVQTNLPQSNKLAWTLEDAMVDFEKFLSLTRDVAEASPRPDVIVWPETMVPAGTISPEALAVLQRKQVIRQIERNGRRDIIPATFFADQLMGTQREIGIPMLVGGEGTDGYDAIVNDDGSIRLAWEHRYNSVFMVERGIIQPTRYDKERLTPFGEFFPYIRHWPWLQRIMLSAGARGMSFNLTEGHSREVFEVPSLGSPDRPVRVVTPICFEVTASGYMRELVYSKGAKRADVVLSPTNDGWFGSSDEGREHHLLMARWRCVELNIPMARSANTGVSAFIDGRGRVLSRGVTGDADGHTTDGVLVDTLLFDPAGPGTAFGRFGNVLGWGCLWGTIGVLLAALWSGRRGAAEGTGKPKG